MRGKFPKVKVYIYLVFVFLSFLCAEFNEDVDVYDLNDGEDGEVIVKVDPSRARSIGCTEEEAWKLYTHNFSICSSYINSSFLFFLKTIMGFPSRTCG